MRPFDFEPVRVERVFNEEREEDEYFVYGRVDVDMDNEHLLYLGEKYAIVDPEQSLTETIDISDVPDVEIVREFMSRFYPDIKKGVISVENGVRS